MQSHLRYGGVTELFDPEELGIAEGERHINQGLETANCLVYSFCVAGVSSVRWEDWIGRQERGCGKAR